MLSSIHHPGDEAAIIDANLTPSAGHSLKKELSLWDLVQMQILLVVGVTWIGTAAREGGSHLVFWIAAILTLFIPSAAVVTYCVRIWPEEGGVYQWTRHVFGPLAGFLCAWNFGIWALLTVSNIGIMSATSLAYSLGPSYAWMGESKPLINTFNVSLFLLILLICIVGLKIGKWVAHFGTFTMILVNLILIGLLFYHPHATATHPHHSPQAPFSLAIGPAMFTLLSLNLFSKMSLNALTGLEQIAVFAGEIKHASSAIWKSAWLAAPIIALIFILGTGAILTYIPAEGIDLNGPVPQILAAAFGNGDSTSGFNWGMMLGRGAIFAIMISVLAQYALIVAETSRLPMVAGWDRLLPEWFTRLSPRFGTPVRSIVVIVALALVACTLATLGTDAHEAMQVLNVTAAFVYDIYFGMMLLIPLVIGNRFGKRPGPWLKLAAASGFGVTVLHMVFSVFPIITLANPLLFGIKIIGASLIINLVGVLIFWSARRASLAP
jgi:amino acid transporter